MINKPLDSVTWDDILTLKTNKIKEGRILEYMKTIPNQLERDALSYFKPPKSTGNKGITMTICAFANSEGGDLLIGVNTKNGIPFAFPGIADEDEEALKDQLENWVKENLEPRLPLCLLKMIPIPDEKGRAILIIRVPKSARAPHRHKKNGHFFGRDEKGNYRFDMRQLRQAFILSETMIQKIQNFQADRLIKIGAGHTPLAIQNGITMVMHIVPVSAVFDRLGYQWVQHEDAQLFLKEYWPQMVCRKNRDGFVLYTETDEKYKDYIQYFHDGVIESVTVFPLKEGEIQTVLPADEIGHIAVGFVEAAARILSKNEQNSSYYVFMSFLKMRGAKLDVLSVQMPGKSNVHVRDSLILPEILVDDKTQNAVQIMRPQLDKLWRAFGYDHCLNYNEEGEWSDLK